jgi:murein DD-endopeptidase MepM/ murein hydrolase activator NlpD
VPLRSPDARHRVSRKESTKPHRLMAALALTTVTFVALALMASGAITSPKTKPVTFGQNPTPAAVTAALTAPQAAAEDLDVLHTHRPKAVAVEDDLALTRATAAARAARSAQRTKIVALVAQVARAAKAHSWRLPVKNYVLTSGFGYRWGNLHAGEDFAVPTGTNLVAMSTGTVDFAGQESGYGNLVKICYWDGTISFFAHMSSISLSVGDRVGPGELVGLSGNTGDSTGPHLHLEIHPGGGAAVDPLPWLAAHNIAP